MLFAKCLQSIGSNLLWQMWTSRQMDVGFKSRSGSSLQRSLPEIFGNQKHTICQWVINKTAECKKTKRLILKSNLWGLLLSKSSSLQKCVGPPVLDSHRRINNSSNRHCLFNCPVAQGHVLMLFYHGDYYNCIIASINYYWLFNVFDDGQLYITG